MQRKTKAVKGARTTRRWVGSSRRAALRSSAHRFVEQLALSWVADGKRGDEPGSAKEAYDLLIKHGYMSNSTRTLPLAKDWWVGKAIG